MKLALSARLLFGAAAVLFGVLCLMWWDADTWQGMARFWKLPYGRPIGGAVMVATILGGLLLPVPRTTRLVALVLGAVFVVEFAVTLPVLVAHPDNFFAYYGLFELLLMFSGALAAYATTETNPARVALYGRLARIGVGLAAIPFAAAHVLYLKNTTSLIPTWLPPGQDFWAYATALFYALAAVALLINRQAPLAARLMALMMGLFGVLVWIPQLIAKPNSHNNWSEFAYTFLFAGAAWVVAELLAAKQKA